MGRRDVDSEDADHQLHRRTRFAVGHVAWESRLAPVIQIKGEPEDRSGKSWELITPDRQDLDLDRSRVRHDGHGRTAAGLDVELDTPDIARAEVRDPPTS